MKKNMILIFAMITIFGSCKKEFEVHITGSVLDIATNEPIDSVEVKVIDGSWHGSGIVGGFEPTGKEQTVYTNENGEFVIDLIGEETCYVYLKKTDRTGLIIYDDAQEKAYAASYDSKVDKNLTLYMQANRYFDVDFKKNEPCSSTDSLIVTPIPYKKGYINKYEKRIFTGCGFNYFMQEVISGMYFHYKMDYTKNGVWKSKIDSVFIESFKSYSDTIYY